VAVMTSSIVAALPASTILMARSKKYEKIQAAESVDDDGIPDVYRR
jgi:Na+:H+ antiporter, NhaA family